MTAVALLAVAAFLTWLSWRVLRTDPRIPRRGENAPDFELNDQYGVARSSTEFRGHWLGLYFYPRDDTPGCTRQALCLRDAYVELQARQVVVCGVSVDDAASHARFARKHELPFILLADETGATAEAYGSLLRLGPLKFARRNLFVIDPSGRVAAVHAGVQPSSSASLILQAVVAQRATQVPVR